MQPERDDDAKVPATEEEQHERLRACLADVKRLRAEAEVTGEEAFHDLRKRLDGVERRAKEIERDYDADRTVPDAGRRLSDKLDRLVEELGDRIEDAWRRIKRP